MRLETRIYPAAHIRRGAGDVKYLPVPQLSMCPRIDDSLKS